MRKREAQSARYSARNPLVACGISEPFNESDQDPLVLSLKLLPDFQGRLAIKSGGGHIVITCKDVASKRALIRAFEDVLAARNLDERKWRDTTEQMEQERREGT